MLVRILSGYYENPNELSLSVNGKEKKYYCIESITLNGHWTEQSVLDLAEYLPNTTIKKDNNFDHVEKFLHLFSKSNTSYKAILRLNEDTPVSSNYIYWTFLTTFKPFGAIIHRNIIKTDNESPIFKFLVDFQHDDKYESGLNPISLKIRKHYLNPNSNCKILQSHLDIYRNSKKSQERLRNKQKQYHNFAYVASQFQGYKEICLQDPINHPIIIETLSNETKKSKQMGLRTFIRIFPNINKLLLNAYSDFENFKQTINFEIDTSFKIFSPYVFCIVCYVRAGTGIPIGYIIGPSETHELYNSFFKSLRKYIGEEIYDKIKRAFYFESDQGKAILSFYNENHFNHCFCHVHIIRNFGNNFSLAKIIKKALHCQSLNQWISTQVEIMVTLNYELHLGFSQNEEDANLYQKRYDENIHEIFSISFQLQENLNNGNSYLEYLIERYTFKTFIDFLFGLKQIYNQILCFAMNISLYCQRYHFIGSIDNSERNRYSYEINNLLTLLQNHQIYLGNDIIKELDSHFFNCLDSLSSINASIYEKIFHIYSLFNNQENIIMKYQEFLNFNGPTSSDHLQINLTKKKKSSKKLLSSPKFVDALDFLGLRYDSVNNQIYIADVLPPNINKWALWERHGMPPNTNFIEGLHGNLNKTIRKNMICGHKLELFDQFLIRLINNYNQRSSKPIIRYLKKRFKYFYFSMKGQIIDPISESMIIQQRFLIFLDIKKKYEEWVIDLKNKKTNIHSINSWLTSHIQNIPPLLFSINENPLIPPEPIHFEYSTKEIWPERVNNICTSFQPEKMTNLIDLKSAVGFVLTLLSNQHIEGTFPAILQIILNVFGEIQQFNEEDLVNRCKLIITTFSDDYTEHLNEHQKEIANYVHQYYLEHQKI